MKFLQCLNTAVILSTSAYLLSGQPIIHAMTQTAPALSHYQVKNYRTVNNANHYLPAYQFEQTKPYQQSVFQTNDDNLYSIPKRSQSNATFTTQYFLPVSYHQSGDLSNPQSVVIVNETAYVMYTLQGGSKTGFVVKYDLNRLKQLGVSQNGQMDILRRATWDQIINKLHNQDQAVLNCIQVGPTFNTGHGQSLAYNSKTHEMWFVLNTGIHAAVQKLNLQTLRPENRITFSLSSTVPMGENLAFDKWGRAYFFTYASGGWAPKGSVKLYRGSITNHRVHFKLIMQGIHHAPGPIDQSLGYNPVNNKLYLIANGSITSVPVTKLGRLKPKDVKTTNFDHRREFEALAFDESGNGYLLVNRGPELMQLNGDL